MSETIPDAALRERARDWWWSLQPSTADGIPNPTGDRAALARLRRSATPADAVAEDATLALFRRLGLRAEDYRRLPRVALIAMVLAHVRADAEPDAGGFRPPGARAVGRQTLEDDDSARMSALRFRRLLACRDDDELAQQMRRLVALADGRINVGDVAHALYYWNDEARGDQIRTRWAFEYYAVGAAAPPDRRDVAPVESAPA
jgi:CRISPR type I-E-associated protein CasB/Cse2